MQPGTRLDHYEIIDLLGEGGMGAVYRAEDTRLKRQVAIKVLPRELAADPERLARLEREAQLLASLNHPNVATVHGFGDVQADVDGEQQRVTFLVMELIEGESLYDRAQMGPMPWRDVVEIGIGIAAGLEAAHDKGIVHRDLKPANVHIATDGTVKVLDFGLAKAFEGDGVSGSLELSTSPTLAVATRTGVILGTAAYMSPEQARGKKVDKRADIWALGCVLYELLAGHKTFDGETVSDILAAILREDPDLDALPAIPPTLKHVLQRCLEKQPARRMRNVGDVRLELEVAREERARPASQSDTGGSLAWKLAAGLTAVAALTGALAGYMLRGGPPPRPEARVILSSDTIAGGVGALGISPDGRWIAESSVLTNSGIRIRAMDDVRWREIPDSEGALSLVFSADSQSIYFTRGFFSDETGVHRVDVDGASPILEATLPAGFAAVLLDNAGHIVVSHHVPPAYSLFRLESNGTLTELASGKRDATALLVTSQIDETHWLGFESAGQEVIGLGILDSATAEIISLLPGLTSPHYLGDGMLLAVDERGRLVSARIDPATGTVIEPPAVRLEGLSMPSGTTAEYDLAGGRLVYSAGETGSFTELLAWLDASGAVEPLTAHGGRYEVDSFVSPDGTRLALEMRNPNDSRVSIWIHELDRDLRTALVPGLTTTFPVWSPDSKHLAYLLADETRGGIYRVPIDRSEVPTLLLANPENGFALPMSWSPDGKYLLYVDGATNTRNSGTRNDLWLLPLDGSDPVSFLATEASEVDGRFSPDSRWIAYGSDQSGRREIYVRGLQGGGEYQISAAGGASPEWNPTGGQLFFLQGQALYVVDIDLRGATPIASAERLLVELPPRINSNLYAPAPTGDRFLVAQQNAVGDVGASSLRAIFDWSFLRDRR